MGKVSCGTKTNPNGLDAHRILFLYKIMAKLIIKNKYGIAPNEILNNENISLKAKGLYTYLQSKPDGWKFSIQRISLQTKDGKSAVREAIKELENFGYLKRIPLKDDNGRWNGYDYELFENPLSEKRTTENPMTENYDTISNKDISKKDIVIKNTLSKDKGETREYGNPNINKIINYLKEKFNLSELDGSVKQNRNYANLLLKKIGGEKYLDGLLALIDFASHDKWWCDKITSTKDLYYNVVKIYQKAKNKGRSNGYEDLNEYLNHENNKDI